MPPDQDRKTHTGSEDLERTRQICLHLEEIAREAQEIGGVLEHVLENHGQDGFIYPENPMDRVLNIKDNLTSIETLAMQILRRGLENSKKKTDRKGQRKKQ